MGAHSPHHSLASDGRSYSQPFLVISYICICGASPESKLYYLFGMLDHGGMCYNVNTPLCQTLYTPLTGEWSMRLRYNPHQKLNYVNISTIIILKFLFPLRNYHFFSLPACFIARSSLPAHIIPTPRRQKSNPIPATNIS